MDEIGEVVTLQIVQQTTLVKEAAKFRLLELRILPLQHEISAEVALFDASGEPVGPARWVQLNPLPPLSPEEDPLDNWNILAAANFAGLKEFVKTRIKEELS